MRSSLNSWLGAALVAVIAQTPRAQQVRGVVRDSTAGIPLPGAVVVILDSARVVSGRAIADAAGRFVFGRRSTSVSVRVNRIGYRPREVSIPPGQGDFSLDLAMARIPPLLDAVRVTDRVLCPGSTIAAPRFSCGSRFGQAFSRRSSRMTKAPRWRMRYVSSARAPTDRVIQTQTIELRSGRSIRPFVAAASAAAFATEGYIEEDPGGRTFRAPDSEVLLDESFAATHCFHLQAADAAHAGDIGLAFTPRPDRHTIVDVSGVIWIDDAIRELRSFDFLYTELEPAAMRVEAGGHMVFTTAPNGVSFIEQWIMRLPVLTAPSSLTSTAPPPRRRQDRRDLRVSEIEETGGLMLDATWDDRTTWSAKPTGLAGITVENRSQSPIAGAIVALDGTSDTAVANARGAYAFARVLPGRYSATISDTSLAPFAPPRRVRQIVDVVAGTTAQFAPVPMSAAESAADACKERKRPATHPIVVGQVQAPSDATTAPLSLGVQWGANGVDDAITKIDVDNRGRFLVCGAPSDQPIRLRVAAGRMVADTMFVAGNVDIARIRWQPKLALVTLAQQRVIRGTVRDTAGRALSGVQVNLVTGQRTTTDDAGRFRISAPSREEVLLDIRRVGFTPSLYTFGEGADTTLDVVLLPLAQQLDAVKVNARGSSGVGLEGFDQRMRDREHGAGAGYFITGAEIERRQAARVTSLFDEVPGIFVLRVSFNRSSIFARSRTFSGKCPANVYIDGTRIMEKFDTGEPGVAVDELLIPSNIAGIEVYSSGNTAPPAYQGLNGSCAVVVIWTKRGEKTPR